MSSRQETSKISPFERLTRSKWAVLIVLFTVTAALGLPLLWMSPAFRPVEKWIWSIVVVAYTIFLVAVTVWIVLWAWRSITGAWG